MNVFSEYRKDGFGLYKILESTGYDTSPSGEVVLSAFVHNSSVKLYSYYVLKFGAVFILDGDKLRIQYTESSPADKIKHMVSSSPKDFRGYRWFTSPDGVIIGADKVNDFNFTNLKPENLISISEVRGALINCPLAKTVLPFTTGPAEKVKIDLIRGLFQNVLMGLEVNDRLYIVNKAMLPLILFSRCGMMAVRTAYNNKDDYNALEKIFWYQLLVHSRELFDDISSYKFPEKLPHFDTLYRISEERNHKQWIH